MNTKLLRKEGFIWLILIIPFVYLAFIWNNLPDQIPLHWNVNDEVDNYGSKVFGTLLLPLFNIGIYFLMLFIPRIDPKRRNYELFAGPFRMIRGWLAVFMVILFFVIIQSAMGTMLPVGRIVTGSVMLLFAMLGYYMRNIKPNWFVGIRTPWTLENETVWEKTHLLGGKMWLYGGLVGLLFVFFLEKTGLVILLATLIPVMVVVPVVYSWMLFNKNRRNEVGRNS